MLSPAYRNRTIEQIVAEMSSLTTQFAYEIAARAQNEVAIGIFAGLVLAMTIAGAFL
jgi:hypothetical protein